MGKQLQSLILELVAVWPIQIIGNIIWTIFDYWLRMIEVMLNRTGLSKPESMQWVYQLIGLDGNTETNFARSQIHLNPETSHLLIGLDLPLAFQQHTTTTEIAIPVLLPDLLDTSEATPSHFFEEHFEIYVEHNTPIESMDICLINPDGQVLFHSQPTGCPLLKPWQPLALPTGQG